MLFCVVLLTTTKKLDRFMSGSYFCSITHSLHTYLCFSRDEEALSFGKANLNKERDDLLWFYFFSVSKLLKYYIYLCQSVWIRWKLNRAPHLKSVIWSKQGKTTLPQSHTYDNSKNNSNFLQMKTKIIKTLIF